MSGSWIVLVVLSMVVLSMVVLTVLVLGIRSHRRWNRLMDGYQARIKDLESFARGELD